MWKYYLITDDGYSDVSSLHKITNRGLVLRYSPMHNTWHLLTTLGLDHLKRIHRKPSEDIKRITKEEAEVYITMLELTC